MASTKATVGSKVTAAMYNQLVTATDLQYGTNVIPTSVTGASLSTTGKVTFTAATSIAIDGCFTATYPAYNIEIYISASSATQSTAFVFRSGGTDVTSANYDQQVTQGSVSTASAAQAIGSVNFSAVAVASTLHTTTMKLVSPALAAPTLGSLVAFSTLNPMTAAATTATVNRGLLHRLSTAYDGFKLTPSSGNITGWVVITGLNVG